MSGEAAATRTARLSRRLSVTVTASRLGVVAEWSPDKPRKLTRKELVRYRRVRDEALAELAARTREAVVVVEI